MVRERPFRVFTTIAFYVILIIVEMLSDISDGISQITNRLAHSTVLPGSGFKCVLFIEVSFARWLWR